MRCYYHCHSPTGFYQNPNPGSISQHIFYNPTPRKWSAAKENLLTEKIPFLSIKHECSPWILNSTGHALSMVSPHIHFPISRFFSLFPDFSQVIYTTREHAQHKTLSSVSLKKKKKKQRPQAHLPPTSSSCKVKVKVTPTLCYPMDYIVRGIL